MKKMTAFLLAALLICMMASSVSAAVSAFERITVTADYPVVIDADNAEGRGGTTPASYVEDFGIGNTWIDDVAEFKDVDFGSKGASKATINMSFGLEDQSTTIEMYIDSLDSKPVATYECGYTGGWNTASGKDFTADVQIPSGTHTVYVKWVNETGSLFGIEFEESATAIGGTTDTNKPADTTAPAAADMGLIAGIAGVVVAGAAMVALKKRH